MENKKIPGFEGYEATPEGQIWSNKTNKFMNQYDNGQGYVYVCLYANGKKHQVRVNRLVCAAFHGEAPEGKTIVGHKDDCRTNNHYSNLFWTTQKENLDTDSFREKAKKKLRTEIRCVETGEVFPSQTAAARWAQIHKYGINNVLMGKQKTAGGYHWERVMKED